MPEPQAPILREELRKFPLPKERWDLWTTIQTLHYNMAFSGFPDLAREILDTFIASLPQGGRCYNPHYTHPILSIWTHLPSSKPTNLPSNWPSEPLHLPPASKDPDRDIFSPAFHNVFSRTGPTPRNPPAASDLIDLETLDPHSWPESTNPRHVAACARVLCRVPAGGVPTREAIGEAFDAMERVWELLLSQERDAASGLPPLVYDEVFPATIYLSFAIGLGRRDKATLMFQRLVDGWGLVPDGAKSFHVWAKLYELCLREGGWLNLITREDAEACMELAKQALTAAEPAAPPPPPLPSLPPMFTPEERWPARFASSFQIYPRARDTPKLWPSIFNLHHTMTLSGHLLPASALLEHFLPHLPPRWKPTDGDATILQTIWTHAPAAKPPNLTPSWPQASPLPYAAEVPERNIFHPNFWRTWSRRVRTPEREVDPHSWRTMDMGRDIAACIGILCRVPAGQVPPREAIEEAYEAMGRLRQLSVLGGASEGAFHQLLPGDTYLCFCAGLGKRDRVRQICREGGGLFYARGGAWRELYETRLAEGEVVTELITAVEAEACVDMVKRAYDAERRDPLQEFLDLGWRELLRRFSEAAFTVHRKQYRRLENPPRRAEEILLPPISPAALAEVEEKTGPLPADLRAMVVVANGFKGLWHTFGGGFPGVDKFAVEPCGDSWLFFGGRLFIAKDKEPSKEAKKAPIWVACGGAVESDDFNHIICPAETWRKLVGDDHYTAGEYRITYTAHWSDGDSAHTSMREWIATETMRMEQLIAKGSWEEMDDDSDDDDEEEEDE
jgi:hypothetical protein